MSRDYPTWTARLPADVKEYLQKTKGKSAGKCLVEYYNILQSTEVDVLIKEKRVLQERVLQIDEIVTHLKEKSELERVKHIEEIENRLREKIKHAYDPDFYIGKNIDGITVTKEMVDKIKEGQ